MSVPIALESENEMSNIKYTVKGRSVPLSQFGDEVKKGLETQVEKTIKRIETARCPVHHQGPKNIRIEIEGGNVRWTFEKCCDELERAAAATLQ